MPKSDGDGDAEGNRATTAVEVILTSSVPEEHLQQQQQEHRKEQQQQLQEYSQPLQHQLEVIEEIGGKKDFTWLLLINDVKHPYIYSNNCICFAVCPTQTPTRTRGTPQDVGGDYGGVYIPSACVAGQGVLYSAGERQQPAQGEQGWCSVSVRYEIKQDGNIHDNDKWERK